MSVPEILHQSTGLKIVRNPINQFIVCTLHHTADPNKRSEEWRREAAAGLTPEQAARELDIDYTAVMGAKVFPEITNFRTSIVVEEKDYPFLGDAKYYGGLDYGLRNPSSFHVYAVGDGMVYSIWELFKPCHNIAEFCQEMRACPYFNKLKWIAADPSFWAPRAADIGDPTSLYKLFWQAGVRNLIKGINNQEDTWLTMMREYWASEDATFRIFERCSNQIREFETAIFVNQSERQLLTTAYNEKVQDKDNHSLDDCKYMMLSLPKSSATSTVWEDPHQINRWSLSTGNNYRPAQRTRAVQPKTGATEGVTKRGYR